MSAPMATTAAEPDGALTNALEQLKSAVGRADALRGNVESIAHRFTGRDVAEPETETEPPVAPDLVSQIEACRLQLETVNDKVAAATQHLMGAYGG